MLPSTVADVGYNNDKLRRRSHFTVTVRSIANNVFRCNVGSCGIGWVLSFLMIGGLFYLSMLHSSDGAHPFGSRLGLTAQNLDGDRRIPKDAAGTVFTKAPGQKVPFRKLIGRELSLTRPPNVSINQDHPDITKPKTSVNLLWRNRQIRVVDAFRHAWRGYNTYAMGFDELMPVRRSGTDGLGGLGATVIDALDTAMIMGLDDVVAEAGSWIEKELLTRITTQGQVNLFETTIRVLGGLLSAYHLSGGGNNIPGRQDEKQKGPNPEIYLDRAKALADRLMSAFTSSPTAIPYADVILRSNLSHPASTDGGASSTSEVTTLQLEFGYLSEITGDPKYEAAAMQVLEHFKGLPKTDGLVPIYISPHSGQFHGNNIRLGSRGDSYYEYLLKVWLRKGGATTNHTSVSFLHEMYEEAMEGVKRHLVRKSKPKGLTFVGELPHGLGAQFSPKMDHLVCFLAGNLALGATKGLTKQEAIANGMFDAHDEENFKLAEALTKTCYEMYAVTATGLAPEIAYFHMDGPFPEHSGGGNPDAEYKEDIIIQPLDRHNLLRPETVESLLILYRTTEDPKYRDWGWKIFEAFDKHTRVDTGGFTSLDDVTVVPAPKRDKMETFFLGETLKYIYLLFGDSSVLPLNKYVFNTEAHPLPITTAVAVQ